MPLTSDDARDITANYHCGNPYSTAAHASIVPAKSIQRARIRAYVGARGKHGATCDEIEQALQLSHQAASARCTELLKSGGLVWHDQAKRRTRSGRWARVYHLPDERR